MSLRVLHHRLATSPSFFILSVLTLAVGIAATTAIFSVVDTILIQPLPYSEPERLVAPMHHAPKIGLLGQAAGTYRLYRDHNRVFDQLAIYTEWAATLSGEGAPERLDAVRVTPSIFPVLGLTPALGRAFREDDGLPGADPVVILGDALWRRRFGADPEIIGRSLLLNGVPTEVVGVLKPGVAFPRRGFDTWMAMQIDPGGMGIGIFGNQGIARLAEGVTAEAAEADLNRLIANIESFYPGDRRAARMKEIGVEARVPWFRDEVVGEVESVLQILLATMAVVLAIACVNVANLFLVRAEGRRHETAVRIVQGATRRDLMRNALLESMPVAAVAGLLGLAGAWIAVRLLVLFGPEDQIPRLHEVGIDSRSLAFTALLSLAAVVIFSLIPALAVRRRDLVPALSEGGGRSVTAGGHRYLIRRLLVVVQVALAMVLAIGAGLMVRSFENLSQVDLGFDADGVTIARVALPQTEYPDDVAAAAFFDQLLERLGALPGIEKVGAISALPIAGSFYRMGHSLRDQPVADSDSLPIFERAIVSHGYLEAMSIPLLEGRFLERADYQHRTGAVVVSETLARRHWGMESALGKQIIPGRTPDNDTGWFTIVGVAGDVRSESLIDPPREIVYYPLLARNPGSWSPSYLTLTIRTAAGVASETVVSPVRNAVASLDPNLPVFFVRTLEDIVEEARAPMAFTVVLLLAAAAVALILGGVGTYGVVSYLVGRRTAEIGVRMAIGAYRSDILGMVLRQGLVLGGTGAVLGVAGAVLLTRWLESILFEVDPLDPLTFIIVPLVLLAAVLAASYMPARRASQVEPSQALRDE
jgi:predicted permease